MTGYIKPIETIYRGYRFRSRLEARWAVFFDALEIGWEYEPEGYQLDEKTRYLPDFFITGNGHRGPFIEIKAQEPTEVEIDKLVGLCGLVGAYGVFLYGQPGQEKWISIHKDGARDGLEDGNCFWQIMNMADDKSKVDLAYRKARGARFEYGETP